MLVQRRPGDLLPLARAELSHRTGWFHPIGLLATEIPRHRRSIDRAGGPAGSAPDARRGHYAPPPTRGACTAALPTLATLPADDLQPVFLVTAGRSGSTLLRLILDEHPEIGCPGETGLPSLIGHLANVWHTIASDVERAHVEVMSAEVKAAVRAAASAPMRFYIEAEGKRVFADKSLETAWYLPAVHDIFPEAKFLLLFRHVMDVVASGVSASPWGFQAFGYAPYVARSVDNFVAPPATDQND